MSARRQAVAGRFGAAALRYDAAASVQRIVASRLAEAILAAGLKPGPRILEIGAGTGLLTRALRGMLPQADWVVSDLAEPMLRQCRAALGEDPRTAFLAMDAQAPALRPGFDLICGNLVLQWLPDRPAALAALAGMLAEGGLLAVSTVCAGSFSGWRAALLAEKLGDNMPEHTTEAVLQAEWPPGGAGHWRVETVLERHQAGIGFLRGLRAVGADLPRDGARPADPLALRRVLRRFEREHGAVADWRIGIGLFRRQRSGGVFVTGTDTGVGKTLVAALFARAWQASYWKPLQTGLAAEPGDSETVQALAGLAPGQLLPPRHEFRAPLSPQVAARLEGVGIDPDEIRLPPAVPAPLVVEGAGGLMVPVADGTLMIDLIGRFGLPVVLVARGTLGTINHTLLSLEALRRRSIPVAGIVLCGECTASNREAVASLGGVRILAQVPHLDRVDAQAVAALAGLMPSLASLGV